MRLQLLMQQSDLQNSERRIPVPRFKYLRQGISLTGLGTATFTNALDAAHEIHQQFDRQFEEGVLERWSCSSADNASPCIDISNRYLTPAKEAGGTDETPFHKGVDPKGILQSMANGDGSISYMHTEDNQVRYFNMHRDTEGNRKLVYQIKDQDNSSHTFWGGRFVSCEPQMFRIGDIVQVQISFVVIPIKGGRRKMLTVLRSIALLDGTFSKQITNSNTQITKQVPSKMKTLKRRIGYDEVDEAAEDRNEKRNKMAVDEGDRAT